MPNSGRGQTKDLSLTESLFWDEGWEKVKLPVRLDTKSYEGLCFDRLLREKLVPGDKMFLEVGCAPGKFMIYFSEYFGYEIAGIDFSPVGCEVTKKNLKLAKLPDRVMQGDFLTYALPQEKWDIVFSAGFIEHFTDPLPILQKMVGLLKPGGILFTTIPNMAGFPGTIRKKMNRDIYNKHNPLAADDLFKAYKTAGLANIDIGYFGSLRVRYPKPNPDSFWKHWVWMFARIVDRLLIMIYRVSKRSLEGKIISLSIYACGKKPEK